MKCRKCNGKDCLDDNDTWWYCNECGANINKEVVENGVEGS